MRSSSLLFLPLLTALILGSFQGLWADDDGAPTASTPRVTVADFAVPANVEPTVGTAIADLLSVQFDQRSHRMVGRGHVRDALSRLDLAPTGLADDPESASALGAELGADFVVVGSVIHLGRYHVAAMVVDVARRRVRSSAVVSATDLTDLADQLPRLAAGLFGGPQSSMAIPPAATPETSAAPLLNFSRQPGVAVIPPGQSPMPRLDWSDSPQAITPTNPWGGLSPSTDPTPVAMPQRRDVEKLHRVVNARMARSSMEYRVVAGVYYAEYDARRLHQSISTDGFFPVEVVQDQGAFHVVVGPPYTDEAEARLLAESLKDCGYFDVVTLRTRQGMLP